MTSTETYTSAATQAREATEKSVEAFRNGAKSFTEQLDAVKLPTVDLTKSVTRYFEYVQKAVDLNRDLTTTWAEMVTSLAGSVREQAEKVGHVVEEQTGNISDLTVKQAEKAEQAAKDQADTVEQAKRAQVDEIEEANAAAAREPYDGLTKAELGDLLTERGLPRTGNLDDLIARLVSADSE